MGYRKDLEAALEPGEELVAAVDNARMSAAGFQRARHESIVSVGLTNRRVLLVGRRKAMGSFPLGSFRNGGLRLGHDGLYRRTIVLDTYDEGRKASTRFSFPWRQTAVAEQIAAALTS